MRRQKRAAIYLRLTLVRLNRMFDKLQIEFENGQKQLNYLDVMTKIKLDLRIVRSFYELH